jgi:large subunit ribosomal protein L18e
MKPTGPTNQELRRVVLEMKKAKKYPGLVKALSKPRRKKVAVNLYDLDAIEGEKKVAAAEVLGSGEITKPMWVYAWRFSAAAKEKIAEAGGKCFSLTDLLKEKDNVKVIL